MFLKSENLVVLLLLFLFFCIILRGCAHDVLPLWLEQQFFCLLWFLCYTLLLEQLWREEDHRKWYYNNINGKFITARANLILCSRSVICTVQEWMNNKVASVYVLFLEIYFCRTRVSSMNELHVLVFVCLSHTTIRATSLFYRVGTRKPWMSNSYISPALSENVKAFFTVFVCV